MSTTAKMTPKAKIARSTSQTLIKQGRKLDLENYCAPGVRDLWMPMLIFALNLASIFLGIYRLDKVRPCWRYVEFLACMLGLAQQISAGLASLATIAACVTKPGL